MAARACAALWLPRPLVARGVLGLPPRGPTCRPFFSASPYRGWRSPGRSYRLPPGCTTHRAQMMKPDMVIMMTDHTG